MRSITVLVAAAALLLGGGVVGASLLAENCSAPRLLRPDGCSTSTAPGSRQPRPDPPAEPLDLTGWTPASVERFARFDTRRWTARDQTYSSNEASHLQAANVSVRSGSLRIQGRKEAVNGRAYTSGYVISTPSHALPDYFRAEVRAKVPMEQGMWAAPLWFRPLDGSGGEIDLVETYGSERGAPLVHQTLHAEYGPRHRQVVETTAMAAFADPRGTDWHVYTIEKVPGEIRMYTDGVPTAHWSSGDPEWFDRYFERGRSWDMRINLQIGGRVGGLPDRSTVWSSGRTTLTVDYVKTWVRSPGQPAG
ncbi:MAG TPA: glycoside hydrolase family 16 protein [Nocardioidaceae bacterium]|nr:glycoside hydrolase family 16 protein [Nocardioidaceae bacterium]